MLSKWLQKLRGGSGSSTANEPATAPEPPSLPAEPPPADTGMGEVEPSEPAGDEPA